MIIALGIINIVLGLTFASVSIFNIHIFMGFKKGKTGKINGYLDKVNHKKNVIVHRTLYSHWTEYVYTYIQGK